MMLLFIFFVVLFSFSYKKMAPEDFQTIASTLSGQGGKTRSPLDEVQSRLLKWVVDQRLVDSIEVSRKEDALILEIREKILFERGQFQLKENASNLLSALSEGLKRIPSSYRIGVEGHTDDTPMRASGAERVQDNWELSTRRALSVLKSLELDPETLGRTVVMGYGENRPLFPNRTPDGKDLPENQARNRRVTLRIY